MHISRWQNKQFSKSHLSTWRGTTGVAPHCRAPWLLGRAVPGPLHGEVVPRGAGGAAVWARSLSRLFPCTHSGWSDLQPSAALCTQAQAGESFPELNGVVARVAWGGHCSAALATVGSSGDCSVSEQGEACAEWWRGLCSSKQHPSDAMQSHNPGC